MKKGDLSHLAQPGATLTVRVTPNARQAGIALAEGMVKIAVTEPAAEGRANRAVAEALAQALGVAKTRLTLTRGAQSRDKTFRLD